MGHRDAGVSRGSDSRCDTRDHLNRNVASGEMGCLLSPTTEKKGIPPLEPHHRAVLPGQFHKHGIGARLRHRVMTSALADKSPFTPFRNEIEDLLRHQ